MTMNERVKAVRKSKEVNLTLEKFGERLGLKKNTMSAIETGRNALTEQNIKAICREFGVDYIWLTTGEGDMFVDSDIGLMESFDRIMAGEDDFHKKLLEFIVHRSDEDLRFIEKLLDDAKELYKSERS